MSLVFSNKMSAIIHHPESHDIERTDDRDRTHVPLSKTSKLSRSGSGIRRSKVSANGSGHGNPDPPVNGKKAVRQKAPKIRWTRQQKRLRSNDTSGLEKGEIDKTDRRTMEDPNSDLRQIQLETRTRLKYIGKELDKLYGDDKIHFLKIRHQDHGTEGKLLGQPELPIGAAPILRRRLNHSVQVNRRFRIRLQR